MKKILHYPIAQNEDGLTVGNFLRTQGFSRHIMTHLKKVSGTILLNGTPVFTNKKLRSGDSLTITLLEEEGSTTVQPIAMDLSILYEDEDLLVIDKPADTPIHPSINNHENTLANGLVWYFKQQGIPFVYRCINRLDRDTTGLLIIAKHMLSGSILSQMSANREIHREYMAITEGILPIEGTIDAPIGRKEGSALERCVDFESGEAAVTHYRRISAKHGCSLAAIRLETGRTHQIRVHMKYLGHPLLGDFLYNPESKRMQRQALHSHCLEFYHPITKKPLRFVSPLPFDMEWML